jgi:hypothetical protein
MLVELFENWGLQERDRESRFLKNRDFCKPYLEFNKPISNSHRRMLSRQFSLSRAFELVALDRRFELPPNLKSNFCVEF